MIHVGPLRWHFLPEVPYSPRRGVDGEQSFRHSSGSPALVAAVAEAKAKGKAKAKAKAKAAAAKPKAKAKAGPARGVIKAAMKADPKAKPKAGPGLLQRDLSQRRMRFLATFRQAIAAKEFADVAAKLKKTKSKDSNGVECVARMWT